MHWGFSTTKDQQRLQAFFLSFFIDRNGKQRFEDLEMISQRSVMHHAHCFMCFPFHRISSDMAADDKSSSSSSTDWTAEQPVLSPSSPSHLTQFKPLTPEQDEPPLRSAYSSFVNLFRFSNKGGPPHPSICLGPL
jgi:hypothetical protein